MNLLKKARARLDTITTARLAKRPARLTPGRRVISFTFDDFPRSALEVGGDTLRARGARGTYFAALGMIGRDASVGPLFDEAMLRLTVDAGHELGCHTFHHEAAQNTSAAAFDASLKRNAERIGELLPGHRFRSFSYPYGSVTVGAKRAVERHVCCGRGIGEGINRGVIDANLLLANSLTSANLPLESRLHRVEELAAGDGWLIFYTHDVADDPTPYGCTTDYFAAVVDAAAASGAEILPVAEAFDRLTAPG